MLQDDLCFFFLEFHEEGLLVADNIELFKFTFKRNRYKSFFDFFFLLFVSFSFPFFSSLCLFFSFFLFPFSGCVLVKYLLKVISQKEFVCAYNIQESSFIQLIVKIENC